MNKEEKEIGERLCDPDLVSAWKEATEEGVFDVVIRHAVLVITIPRKKLALRVGYEVVGSFMRGRKITEYMLFGDTHTLRRIAEWISRVGFTPPNEVESLPALLKEMVGVGASCRLQVKRKGDFVFLSVIDDYEYSSA